MRFHGPKAPGPGWVQVDTGPQGGKIWEYKGKTSPVQDARTVALHRAFAAHKQNYDQALKVYNANRTTTNYEVLLKHHKNMTAVVGAMKEPAKPKLSSYGEQMHKWVTDSHLSRAKNLTESQKKLYAEAIHTVMSSMPDAAIGRLGQGIAKGVGFHSTPAELTQSLLTEGAMTQNDYAKLNEIAKTKNAKVGGLYHGGLQKAYLDGATRMGGGEAFGGSIEDIKGTYAHELAHAIDGPGYKLSRDPEWQDAWKSEIISPKSKLSQYGTGTYYEGFAEFGRLVYGTDADRKKIEQQFPKCTAYWKKHGLLK